MANLVSIRGAVPVGLSAAVGAVMALLGEAAQKGDASAGATLDEALESTLGMGELAHLRLIVSLLIVVLGVSLCFIFAVKTKVKAFYTGASVLSVIMTAVPYKTPNGLQSAPGNRAKPNTFVGQAGAPGYRVYWFLASNSGLVSKPNSAFAPQQVRVHLTTADRKTASEVTLTLKNATREVIARSKYSGGSMEFAAAPGAYILTVAVPGYSMQDLPITVPQGKPLDVAALLKPTWVPLGIQALFR